MCLHLTVFPYIITCYVRPTGKEEILGNYGKVTPSNIFCINYSLILDKV